MAVEIIGTMKPKNNGTFPVAEAADILMPDGSRLSESMVSASGIDLSAFDTEGKIVEEFQNGRTKTTTLELDANGNPVKITDSDGNVTTLTW